MHWRAILPRLLFGHGKYFSVQIPADFRRPNIQCGKVAVFLNPTLFICAHVDLIRYVTAFCAYQPAGVACTLSEFLCQNNRYLSLCPPGNQVYQQLLFQILRQRSCIAPYAAGIIPTGPFTAYYRINLFAADMGE